jgi:secreted trypsin-like serine protease
MQSGAYSKRWLSAAAAAVMLVLGTPAPAGAIARGEEVDDGLYPFAVKLIFKGIPKAGGGTRDSACSGGLISPRWVLTAGHCFRDKKDKHVSHTVAKSSTVTVGRADQDSEDGFEARIIQVKQSEVADIALAKLDKPIWDIKPMKLNTKKPKIGTKVRLTGYGHLDGKDSPLPVRMRTGEFTITSVNKYLVGMTGTAPHSNTSPCKNDSGGPYFSEGDDDAVTVIGVVSDGPTCPHVGADEAGRVDSVRPWIQGIIGKDLTSSPPSPKPSASRLAAPASSSSSLDLPPAAWIAVPVAGILVIGIWTAVARGYRGQRRRGQSRKRART